MSVIHSQYLFQFLFPAYFYIPQNELRHIYFVREKWSYRSLSSIWGVWYILKAAAVAPPHRSYFQTQIWSAGNITASAQCFQNMNLEITFFMLHFTFLHFRHLTEVRCTLARETFFFIKHLSRLLSNQNSFQDQTFATAAAAGYIHLGFFSTLETWVVSRELLWDMSNNLINTRIHAQEEWWRKLALVSRRTSVNICHKLNVM